MSPNQPAPHEWFYARQKVKVGPLTWEQLWQLAREGKVLPSDMVLREGTGRWTVAAEVPTLFTTSDAKLPGRPGDTDTSQYGAVEATHYTAVRSEPEATNYTRQDLARAAGGSRLPERFGDYELLEEIARGGMGVIYKARHVKANRIVALKMILSGSLASAEAVERFRTEARAAAALDHPGIVPIYEIGENDGQHFFTMQLVSGGALSQRLQEGPMPPFEAAELVRLVTLAVQAAHERGVIHRDIKPHNILLAEVTKPLVPKLTDFGLARIGDGSSLTRSGEQLGTPSYMPPEQAAGRTNQIGPVSDVYSLGAVLYCLLTGRPPFQAATPLETMRQVMEQEPVAPRMLNPAVPRDLETVCLKCLEKAPERRYTTARELAEELGRFKAGAPVLARPVGIVERLARWGRRNPLVASLASTVLLLLCLGTIVSSVLAARAAANARSAELAREKEAERADREADAKREAAEHKQSAEKALKQSEAERVRAEKALHRVEEELYRAEMARYAFQLNSVQKKLQQGELAQAKTLLMVCNPRMSHWEYSYFLGLCNAGERSQDRLSIAIEDRVQWGLTFSPDGKQLAGTDGNKIKLWDTATGQEIRAFSGGVPLFDVAFSADGKQIAAGGLYGNLFVWEFATGEKTLSVTIGEPRVESVAFSPNGKYLASLSGKNIKLWDLATASVVLTLDPGTLGKSAYLAGMQGIGFSPDGQYITAASSNRILTVWEAATGKVFLKIDNHAAGAQRPTFSPDGKQILSCDHSNGVNVWNSATGERIVRLEGFTGRVPHAAFSPDGRRIVTCGRDGVKLFDAKTGQELLTLTTDKGGKVAFSPDGTRIASGSGDKVIYLFAAAKGQEVLSLQGHTGPVSSIAFSQDGRQLVSGSEDLTVKVWDGTSGGTTNTFKGHLGKIRGVSFSPDASSVASCADVDHIFVWNVVTGKARETNFTSAKTVAFLSGGRHLGSAGSKGIIQLWDLATMSKGRTYRASNSDIATIAFSVDGHLAAFPDDTDIVLWNLESQTEVSRCKGHLQPVTSVAFNSDGTRIASGSTDRTIKVWDPATGNERLTLKGHLGAVTCAVFTPDGKRIVSGGSDSTLRIWDATSGQEILTLRGHMGAVNCVAVAPDGKRVASGGADWTVKYWNLPASVLEK